MLSWNTRMPVSARALRKGSRCRPCAPARWSARAAWSARPPARPVDDIACGQGVAPGEARVGGAAVVAPTLDQQLQAPGLFGHEAAVLRQGEQRELAQLRCSLDRERIDPPMLIRGQGKGAIVLDQLDAIEGAIAPPRGALERVQAATTDEDQLIAFCEIRHGFAVEALAQKIAADPGGRREAEDTARPASRPARDSAPGGKEPRIPFRERGLHLASTQPQMAQRAVLEQRRPVERCVAREVDPGRAEQPAGAGDVARGADDHIVDHGRRDGGPADRVDLIRPGRGPRHLDRLANVHAPILGDERLQVRARYPDHQDRLVLLQDHGAGDAGIEVDPDQDIERLAGVADRLHHLAGMEHEADQLAVPVAGAAAGSPAIGPNDCASGRTSR